MNIKNLTINDYSFLDDMYADGYFPDFLVDRCRLILLELCQAIEMQNVKTLEELYPLTHAATEQLNHLQGEFEEEGSGIETVARDCLAVDIEYIAKAYGFVDADPEALIAPRGW